MKLNPKDFKVILKKEAVETIGDGGDEGVAYEYELDEDGDEEIEAPAPEQEIPDVDWREVFSGSESWDAPKGAMSIGDALAEEINEAVASYMASKPASERPYMPHPKAAKKDSIIVYDETSHGGAARYKQASDELGSLSKSIASQLRRVLFTRSVAVTARDQRRGKLDRRKLHTLNLPGQVQPNKRVFSRAIEGETQNVAITILIDQSGSMAGSKARAARKAAVALGDALNQLTPLGVRFSVFGFDAGKSVASPYSSSKYDRMNPLRAHWYKGFDEDWRRTAPRIGLLSGIGENVDGESLRWAAQQLLAEPCERRILFVLSDGQPAAHTGLGNGRLVADLHRAIEQIGRTGIELVGVGFRSHAAKEFYEKSVTIWDDQELPDAMLSLVRDAFLRNNKRAS